MSTRVTLGRTGLQVSPVCLGTWQLSPRFWGAVPAQDVAAAVRRAFDLGINFYDTADAYGEGHAEDVLGAALEGLPRDQIVVATKVYWHWYPDGRRHGDLSREYLFAACEASLRRLRTEYIDLYQCHSWDPLTPVAETAGALETLREQGKIRHYGVSNWTVEQMRLGAGCGGFATCQPPYSLLLRGIEADLLPYCQAQNIGVLVYSSLQRGVLAGKYTGAEKFDDLRKGDPNYEGERFRTICERVALLRPIADGYGMTIAQLALCATVMHPAIHCAIAGAKNPAQIEETAGACGSTISREDWHRVRATLDVPAA